MEPNNPEYRRALSLMQNGASYRPGGEPFGTLCAGNPCLTLCCAYTLCNGGYCCFI